MPGSPWDIQKAACLSCVLWGTAVLWSSRLRRVHRVVEGNSVVSGSKGRRVSYCCSPWRRGWLRSFDAPPVTFGVRINPSNICTMLPYRSSTALVILRCMLTMIFGLFFCFVTSRRLVLRRPWETGPTSFTERTSDRTMVASMWCPASPAGTVCKRLDTMRRGRSNFSQVVFAALSMKPAVPKHPSLLVFSCVWGPNDGSRAGARSQPPALDFSRRPSHSALFLVFFRISFCCC